MKTSGGETTLSISVKDKRLRGEKENVQYGNFKILFAKKTDEGLVYLKEHNTIKFRDTYLEVGYLDEGDYLIFVHIDWRDFPKEDRYFNVTSYGKGDINFEYIKQNQDGSLQLSKIDENLLRHKDRFPNPQADILFQLFLSQVKFNHPWISRDDSMKQANGEIIRYNTKREVKAGYRFIYIENTF